MTKHGQSSGGVYKTVVQKLTLGVLALVVTFGVEPSNAFSPCPCILPHYCYFVGVTPLIVSGSIVKSCLKEYQEDESEVIAETCEGVHERDDSITSTSEDDDKDDDEEEEYSEDTYLVSEYKLKIDQVYKDELNFTYPDTPRTVEFSSSGLGIDGCRLDFDIGTEVAVALFEEEDGGFSSKVCSATRVINEENDIYIRLLESGSCL